MSDEIVHKLEKLEATVTKQNEAIVALQNEVNHLRDRLENGAPPSTAAKRPSTIRTLSSAAKAANDKKSPRPATTKTPAGKPVSKTLPRVMQVKVPADNKEPEADSGIDPSRKGFYNLGNRKIYYNLPQEYAGQGGKTEAPTTELKLEYIFGYNGKSCRNNLFYNNQNNGEIIYNIAGTGVVFNSETKAQRFFLQHSEDILSLAQHPSRPLVATGQLDPKGSETPYICVWDTNTMEQVKRITYHQRGIISLAFSPDGKYLLSIGNDDSHTLALWEWEAKEEKKAPAKGKKHEDTPLLEQMVSKDSVFGLYFHPAPAEKDEGYYEFVTVGAKHLKMWTLTNAHKKERKFASRTPGTYEKTKETQKGFYAAVFQAGTPVYVVATMSGHLYKLKGVEMTELVEASKARVSALANYEDGFVSGTDDGKLKFWGWDLKQSNEIDLSGAANPAEPRSIAVSGGKLLVGLKSNQILSVDVASKTVAVLNSGHTEEVWGLAVHPSLPIIATGSEDKTLKIWNYADEQLSRSIPFKASTRSTVFSPDGKYLAVGQWNGNVALLETENWTTVWDQKVAGETVDAITYAPDGASIAVGSWDQAIYVINVPEFKVSRTFKGHTSSVFMINFSDDGKYLMSNSRDYEILYWDLAVGQRVKKPSEVADVKWANWNCFLGWPVQGIWTGAGDGTDINSVDRSPDQVALAAGDDFGKVRLFKYPSLGPNAPMKEYPGHSSFVTNVRFSKDGTKLFSCGGNDTGVFQWKHFTA